MQGVGVGEWVDFGEKGSLDVAGTWQGGLLRGEGGGGGKPLGCGINGQTKAAFARQFIGRAV